VARRPLNPLTRFITALAVLAPGRSTIQTALFFFLIRVWMAARSPSFAVQEHASVLLAWELELLPV